MKNNKSVFTERTHNKADNTLKSQIARTHAIMTQNVRRTLGTIFFLRTTDRAALAAPAVPVDCLGRYRRSGGRVEGAREPQLSAYSYRRSPRTADMHLVRPSLVYRLGRPPTNLPVTTTGYGPNVKVTANATSRHGNNASTGRLVSSMTDY